jgi:hypothetical protein
MTAHPDPQREPTREPSQAGAPVAGIVAADEPRAAVAEALRLAGR